MSLTRSTNFLVTKQSLLSCPLEPLSSVLSSSSGCDYPFPSLGSPAHPSAADIPSSFRCDSHQMIYRSADTRPSVHERLPSLLAFPWKVQADQPGRYPPLARSLR